jgi:hypothetical protein
MSKAVRAARAQPTFMIVADNSSATQFAIGNRGNN